MKPAIQVDNLAIKYRRYLRKTTTLKDAVIDLFQGSQFESFWALRDISLTVPKGERLGVIGRNGCGKTTLLRAMAGILPPESGTVTVDGSLVPLLSIAGGFQTRLTGRENAFFNGAMMGLSTAEMEEKIPDIVEFAEIGDFIDSPLSTYSSGMRARLGFAVATNINPEILLLDEVFAVGDEVFQRKARKRVEAFFEAGRTVVMVSHSLNRIRDWCNRCVYIKDGLVAASGDPKDVIATYKDDNAESAA
ncbi:MAG: ABC transporter ATP-binding protein [Myxococcota bacterium]|nr:ABC transporter ATP-binding protein [Myxococcota bacterium]